MVRTVISVLNYSFIGIEARLCPIRVSCVINDKHLHPNGGGNATIFSICGIQRSANTRGGCHALGECELRFKTWVGVIHPSK